MKPVTSYLIYAPCLASSRCSAASSSSGRSIVGTALPHFGGIGVRSLEKGRTSTPSFPSFLVMTPDPSLGPLVTNQSFRNPGGTIVDPSGSSSGG